MLSNLWYKEIIFDMFWEFPAENVGKLLIMIISTLLFAIIGLILIPLDILFLPLYLLYWLLSKIKLER